MTGDLLSAEPTGVRAQLLQVSRRGHGEHWGIYSGKPVYNLLEDQSFQRHG